MCISFRTNIKAMVNDTKILSRFPGPSEHSGPRVSPPPLSPALGLGSAKLNSLCMSRIVLMHFIRVGKNVNNLVVSQVY
jgi:hypothetical protein